MSRTEQKRRQPLLPVLVLFLVLLLAGCSTGSDADRRATSSEPAAVVVATVASEEVASPVPTALPPTVTPTATPPAPLAALVNGQYVFLSDYEQRVAQFEQALFEQGIDPQTDEGQAELDQARQDVLQGMIDSVLIEQGGLELGIGLAEEELESQVEADIASGGGQQAFDEWLQATGQTRDDYKALLREALISQRVMDAVTVDVGTEAEQVHARHILLDSEEAAQEVLALLEQGADFVTVTRDYSLDQATKDNGGDLGWFPRKLVPPELESAAFALQPGQVSGVVRLGDGYHIIQVVEREEARPLPPEMQLDLKLAIFEEWLAERRVAAEIERFAE
jgi:parvulin-like peptidyl-prolyl isomerase